MSGVGNPDEFVFEDNDGGDSSREEGDALDYTPEEVARLRGDRQEVEGGAKGDERVKLLQEERARSRAAEKRMEKRYREMEKKMEEMQDMLQAGIKKRSRSRSSHDSFESRAGSVRKNRSRSRSRGRGAK